MKTNPPPSPPQPSIHGFLPGKLGWIFLWAIGIPIPILLILFLLRGCT
jgi:hypothetical protein